MKRNTRNNNPKCISNSSASSTNLELAAKVTNLEKHVQNSIQDLKSVITSPRTTDVEDRNILSRLNLFQTEMEMAIKTIKDEITELLNRTVKLDQNMEDSKKHCYANCLVISGIPENNEENRNIRFEQKIVECLETKIQEPLSSNDINYCYRLGKKEDREKPRPVVVVFTNRWKRDIVFLRKKNFKGSGIVVTEYLTREKMNLFKVCVTKYGLKHCWTWRGNIYAFINNNKKLIQTDRDL